MTASRKSLGLGIGRFIITANQNLVLADIPAGQKAEVSALLKQYGLDRTAGGLRRNAVACVALPTCGLALAESERYLPSLLTRLEAELETNGLGGRRHHHPHDRLSQWLRAALHGGNRPGGPFAGTCTTFISAARTMAPGCPSCMHATWMATRSSLPCGPIFAAYATGRQRNESFGDFVIRAGIVARTVAGLDFHENLAPALRN